MLLLPFFLKGADQTAGAVDGGRLDLAPFFLGGGSRRYQAQIQELEGAGHGLGRRSMGDS